MTAIAKLRVKVVAGASQNRIVGWLGLTLKLRVHAQPEKGKANSAVVALLADSLGIPARNINIASGQTSRTKVVEIRGMSDAELHKKIDCLAGIPTGERKGQLRSCSPAC